MEERFDMEYFPYTVDGAYSVNGEVVAHFEYVENELDPNLGDFGLLLMVDYLDSSESYNPGIGCLG